MTTELIQYLDKITKDAWERGHKAGGKEALVSLRQYLKQTKDINHAFTCMIIDELLENELK